MADIKNNFQKILSTIDQSPTLRGITASLVVSIFFLIIIAVNFETVIKFLRHGDAGSTNHEILRNIILLIAGIFGVIFAGWRAFTLDKQTALTEQGHITERFIKATEQIGNDKMAVRLGAIYTLWRIAIDSERESDKIAVLDILCAFIRSNKPKDTHKTQESETTDSNISYRQQEDIVAALDFVTKQRHELKMLDYKLNFTGSDLSYHDLRYSNLNEADFTGTQISNTIFDNSDCSNAVFYQSQIDRCSFSETNSNEVSFIECVIERTQFERANIEKSYFISTKLKNCLFRDSSIVQSNFNHSKITDSNLSDCNMNNSTFIGALISNSLFKNSNLQETILDKSDLHSSDFSGANLDNISVVEARVWMSNIIQFLNQEILQKANAPDEWVLYELLQNKSITQNTIEEIEILYNIKYDFSSYTPFTINPIKSKD